MTELISRNRAGEKLRKSVRRTMSILLSLVLPAALPAQTSLTVREFENFLLSRHAQTESDALLARQLAFIQLSQQLTDAKLAKLVPKLRIGPQSAEQIELIAAASVFDVPPPDDLPSQSPPDSLEQNRILQAAREYAHVFARRLPDFLAVRSTQSYDNAPQFPAGKRSRKSEPVFLIHFVGARRRQVAVRGGLEASASHADSGAPDSDHAEGMTTWGEFGPLLTTVVDDAQAGTIAWSRWQNGAGGARLAVFHYTVPRSASHDFVDLWSSGPLASPPLRSFSDKPAYQGELYIDPASGTILGITLNAELSPESPVLLSRLAVQYAPVEIAGKMYVCPVRGVAVSVVHNQDMELMDGGRPERFVNLVYFTEYHKFASTSRILTNR